MNANRAHFKMQLELFILENPSESTPKCVAVSTAALVTQLPNTMATQSISAPAANTRQHWPLLKEHLHRRKEKTE